eukprot:3525052-Pyramimonas_sp.AAC.1
MYSRTASARTAKQLNFVNRAERRLTDATQKQVEAHIYLDSCVARVHALHEEVAHAEDLLGHVKDLEDEEKQDNEREQAEVRTHMSYTRKPRAADYMGEDEEEDSDGGPFATAGEASRS